jgi:hypothetical protein
MIRYHLKDVIVGKIYFLLVRIRIKYMELSIIKRETTGSGETAIVAAGEQVRPIISCESRPKHVQ